MIYATSVLRAKLAIRSLFQPTSVSIQLMAPEAAYAVASNHTVTTDALPEDDLRPSNSSATISALRDALQGGRRPALYASFHNGTAFAFEALILVVMLAMFVYVFLICYSGRIGSTTTMETTRNRKSKRRSTKKLAKRPPIDLIFIV
ncbi:hypothetical protein AAVH_31478 [Aphelenchoides avenae]|nr:hypothetical protein AAVH_31478 [Aphelenchus avenae]